MSKKNLIVGQSGGPTAVINSSLYGVVSEGLRHPEQIRTYLRYGKWNRRLSGRNCFRFCHSTSRKQP